MEAPRSFGHVAYDAPALLGSAVELLRRVLVEVPPEVLSLDTHMRIATLVTRVPTAASPQDAADVPTVTDRPKLQGLRLALGHFRVLERALQSPCLAGTFSEVRDFLLVAARAYPYAPAPLLTSASTGRPATRTVAFRRSELEALRPRLLETGGVSLEDFVLGCAFSWLKSLQARWPEDVQLAALHAPSPLPVPVVHFPRKP